MFGRRALAIVNMLIYVVLFTIISGTLLSIVSSQTRLMEARIRQIRGYYAAESAMVLMMDGLRRGVYNASVSQNRTLGAGWPDLANVSYVPMLGINGTGRINSTYNHTW